MTVFEELESMRARRREVECLPGEVEDELRAARAAVEVARGELRAYHRGLATGAKPNESTSTKLEAGVKAAQAVVNSDWGARLDGVNQAIAEAKYAVQQFQVEHRDDLMNELAAQAVAARDRRVAALEELVASAAECRRVEVEWNKLVKAASIDLPVVSFTHSQSHARQARPKNEAQLERAAAHLLELGVELPMPPALNPEFAEAPEAVAA
jgi:hypothetical protein